MRNSSDVSVDCTAVKRDEEGICSYLPSCGGRMKKKKRRKKNEEGETTKLDQLKPRRPKLSAWRGITNKRCHQPVMRPSLALTLPQGLMLAIILGEGTVGC
ncbi:hypothetical protein ASPBRDRAFT_39018 [Aspergillus brasiliensis CBS 101740]|uniref:Uncharacterized protein n=1 Tax=Aspergillus brasiliensis (strain CBS 101740 / IMI 381727 / IBT 21946) TaxID=767769 RepID=A0A1L9UXW4_ASPBC|nr:hypothetical protein ASPBRDRAFT_39018 [Aspergillus brasiliensis CBS 101740]